ncbi:type II toxin-antitoxin system PemK/MazF family toxin [Methylobacter sp.]|uniref:type II toxin-antitoxin system PemK/MazF family toxin n=1 Tax=Methylobacter sp. TaxID=2051955 RepID=UPI00248A2181|nr:type II toxin-antitoxin system PemK/MazF family toxin [Methylobacter sp.]MDI1277627.1 type II toxin-antitoxin system PemK/MazF family toxin [Methylobacter sp.]MDI1358229.1 type II toxin-antitoxin system PemK/MazF family toxin [Methylobacter sp.]
MVVKRFDVYLIELDPAVGSEIKKTRPCVIVSPNEMNCLKTVLIAPMTTKGFHAPSRVELQFQDKTGLVLLDQLRSVDKSRLVKKLGAIDAKAQKMISSTLVDMFEM